MYTRRGWSRAPLTSPHRATPRHAADVTTTTSCSATTTTTTIGLLHIVVSPPPPPPSGERHRSTMRIHHRSRINYRVYNRCPSEMPARRLHARNRNPLRGVWQPASGWLAPAASTCVPLGLSLRERFNEIVDEITVHNFHEPRFRFSTSRLPRSRKPTLWHVLFRTMPILSAAKSLFAL